MNQTIDLLEKAIHETVLVMVMANIFDGSLRQRLQELLVLRAVLIEANNPTLTLSAHECHGFPD